MSDSIAFTSTQPEPGAWGRIRIQDGGSAKIAYTVIEYGYKALELYDSDPDTISNSLFYNNSSFAIIDHNNNAVIRSNFICQDSADEYTGYGLYLSGLSTGENIMVTGNTIKNYKRGITAYQCSTIIDANRVVNGVVAFKFIACAYCKLQNATVSGDVGEYVSATESVLEINKCWFETSPGSDTPLGLWLGDCNDVLVRSTDIRNFYNYGVYAFRSTIDLGTSSDWGLNQILGDSSAYYVYVVSKTIDSLKAENNWWGSDPPDPGRFSGRVDYDPWLEFPPRPPNQQKVVAVQQTPLKFQLSQNYPNPFNPVTSIQFTVGSHQSPSHITLKIYNILGQLVRTLVDEEKAEGTYTVYWDGRSDNGKTVSSGIYFYKLEAGEFTEVKKMVLLR